MTKGIREMREIFSPELYKKKIKEMEVLRPIGLTTSSCARPQHLLKVVGTSLIVYHLFYFLFFKISFHLIQLTAASSTHELVSYTMPQATQPWFQAI